MAIGRISGPLLKADLLREGVNLAFETDLLYLDVQNSRIGINTASPQYDLDVNGTIRSTGLQVSTLANIADITISGNLIETSEPVLTLGTADTVVYQNKLQVDSIDIENNVISTNVSNENLEFRPNGTGTVEIFADTNVYGNIVATGSITADGDITIGDADTDNVIFNAEIASNIIPDSNNTYDLGSDPATGGKQWADIWTNNFYAGTISTTGLIAAGVDLALRQGNIYYVAENGDDTYSGDHPNDPFGSIKYAVSQASAGDTVHIYPGSYTEIFPIEVPAGVTVKGHSLRSVNISPTTETRYNDAFHINGESTIEDLTVKDFYSGGNFFEVTASSPGSLTVNVGVAPFAHTYVSGGTVTISGTDYSVTGATYTHGTGVLVVTHSGAAITAGLGTDVFLSGLIFSCNSGNRTFPDDGYAFKFATDFTVTTRSPYIRNVSVITKGSTAGTDATDPRGFNDGDAGKGAYIDGAYATASSREAAALFHSVTFITPGVDGLTVTNGARVEWLNCFTYFANRGLYAFDSNDGLRGAGQTSLRVDNVTGSFADGETVTYYDTDGVTVLATGTINGLDADSKFYIDGKITGFETYVNRGGKTVDRYNNPVTDTAIKKFGTSSLQLDGTEDYIGVGSNNDFGFGTDDYTVEAWIYRTASGSTQTIFDFRAETEPDNAVFLGISAANKLYFQVNGVPEIVGSPSLSTGVWYHVALVKNGSTTSLYLSGNRLGTYSDSVDYGVAKPLLIGNTYAETAPFPGHIDEVRISKGVARYSGATYTIPASEFLSDSDTVLLLHFNNIDDSSVVFEDDTQVSQDVRFSGGATASAITLVDLTDFGGEIRSIASANVYGNYGAYGNGPGVLMYLISQNFAYIGTGKDAENDPTLVIQDNEVIELNDAKVRYSSVDHQGDFRVGDLFYVNQQTGEVTFTSADLNIDTTTGITITTGGSTTTITGESIDTGNLRISGNTIESLSGDINIEAASGTVRIDSTGALNLPTGNTAARPAVPELGMVRFNTDTNLFEGYDGNWIALNGVYDLDLNTYITPELTPGANDDIIRFYADNVLVANLDQDRLQVNRIEVDDIYIDGNVIGTLTTDNDLELTANGTGSVVIDELAFKDSSITNTTTNGITYLRNTGSGYFKIEGTGGFVIPVGIDSQRPAPPYNEIGMMRYNTNQRYVEIWDGTSWVSVAGATGSISFTAAENLAVEYVLTLG